MTDPDEIIDALGLEPHPEGGWFRETWRDEASTAIYYLLKAGERSHWHRVDQNEIWHHYAGAPMGLAMSADGREAVHVVLGSDLAAGQRPQAVVPAGTLAGGPSPGRMVARRMHGCASVLVRELRAGARRVAPWPVRPAA